MFNPFRLAILLIFPALERTAAKTMLTRVTSRPARPSGRGHPRPSSIGRSEISCFVPIKMHGAAATLHSWSRLTRFRGTDDACGITIDRASQCSVLPKRERASFRNAEPILGIRWRELQTYLPRNVCQLQVRKSKRGEDE